jgi:uncharacterized protein (TIGR03067 family)
VRTAVLFTFALTLAAVAAPVPKAVKKPTDAELLEGWWENVTIDDGRGPTPHRERDLIRGGALFLAGTLRNEEPGQPIRLDPTRSPKHFDLEMASGKILPGIYQLDGDTLTWCHSQPGQPRPTEFKGGGGTTFCIVLKRAKE